MASTAGRKIRPLPPSIVDGLAGLGYRRMPYDVGGAPLYRHPRHPDLYCTLVMGNIPGEDAVVADWKGQHPVRIGPDELLRALGEQLSVLDSPAQSMPMSSEEQSSD